MKLSERVSRAAAYHGFSKGVKWLWWLRITYVFGAINLLFYRAQYKPRMYFLYPQHYPLLMTVAWVAALVLFFLMGFGIYRMKPRSYSFIFAFYIAIPFLYIVMDQSFIYAYAGRLNFSADYCSQILGSIIMSAINVYYFHNRKILFDIEAMSPDDSDSTS